VGAPKASEDTEAPQRLPVDEQSCVLLEHIHIQSPFQSKELQAALSGPQADDPPQGRCLGSQGITLLVQRVQEALLERGYITSQVHVPEQDLTKGTLELRVEEGRVGRIRSASNSPSLPRNAFALKEGQILNLRDIEQSVDNLQRLPSLKNHIQIEPAETEGRSDLVVELEAKRPWRIGLSLDDTGNRSTGKLQGGITFNWDNPLGLADLFYISQTQGIGQKETGPRGSRSHVVHYSVPFGYWLLGLTHSQSEYQQTVYGLNEQYLYSGSSSHSELALQRVLFRDGSRKTTASLKAFDRQSRNYIADLEVLVQHRRFARLAFPTLGGHGPWLARAKQGVGRPAQLGDVQGHPIEQARRFSSQPHRVGLQFTNRILSSTPLLFQINPIKKENVP
jgi:hemolysin activation/secretion protein